MQVQSLFSIENGLEVDGIKVNQMCENVLISERKWVMPSQTHVETHWTGVYLDLGGSDLILSERDQWKHINSKSQIGTNFTGLRQSHLN